MLLAEVVSRVGGRLVTGDAATPVAGAYASDLLSDVMGHCGEGAVLITIQNHLNTLAVATLAGIVAIVLCHDRPVPEDLAAAAAREGVALVVTPLAQFAACVALRDLPPAGK